MDGGLCSGVSNVLGCLNARLPAITTRFRPQMLSRQVYSHAVL